MTMNLIFSKETTEVDAGAIWGEVKTVSDQHGMVELSDDTVDSIARLLESVIMINGEPVAAYPADDDGFYEPFVSAFGPSMVDTWLQDRIRDRLAQDANGKTAVRLFDIILKHGIQVAFHGKDHCFARMSAVNWRADDCTINRCASNMFAMLDALEIAYDAKADSGEVSLEAFEQAVEKHGWKVDVLKQVDRFIACAKRHNATTVYWA